MTLQGLFPALVAAIFAALLVGYVSWQASKVRAARAKRLQSASAETGANEAEQQQRYAEQAYNQGAGDYARATIRAAEDRAHVFGMTQGELFNPGEAYTFAVKPEGAFPEDQLVHPIFGTDVPQGYTPIIPGSTIPAVPGNMYNRMTEIATGAVRPAYAKFYGGARFPSVPKPTDKTHG